MNTKIFEIAKPHIESSLEKGNEKLDITNLLTKSKKYGGAITDYVGAYEEIGQALFLFETISNNEKITDDHLKGYLKPGTHNQKILDSYVTRRDRIKNILLKILKKLKTPKSAKIFRIRIRELRR